MEYLWLLPVLLPAVMFFFGNCPCCGSALGCATAFECSNFEVPRFWSIDWGTVSEGTTGTCPDCCYWISQIRFLVHEGTDCGGNAVSDSACHYYGAYAFREDEFGAACAVPASIANALCTEVEAYNPDSGIPGYGPTTEATVSTDGTTISLTLTVYCIESVSGGGGVNPGGGATYSGSGPDDGSAITLSLDTSAGDCAMPASITATPATGVLAKMLAGCLCSPLLVPSSADAILRLNFSIAGGTGSACLGGSQDPDTLIWSWTGTGTVELGTCDGDTLQFDIFLDESAIDLNSDTQVCAWKLRITDASSNVEELPIEVTTGTPVNVDASGTLTTICGGGAFAGTAQEFTGLADDRHPYMRCCVPTIAEQCDLPTSIQAAGEVIPSAGSTCVTSTESWVLTTGSILCGGSPITLTGFDDTKDYFLGDFPIDDGFGTGSYQVVLYCDDTSMRYAVLSGGCELESGAVTSWDCGTKTGYIDTTVALDGCTPGGATARINLG